MTVSSIIPVNNYNGNSSSTTFDFDFLIEKANELVVEHTNSKGKTSTLEYGVDYSINEIGNKNGSFITFPLSTSKYSILAYDETISLHLSLDIVQENEFSNSFYFNFNVLEWTFDYITRILQIISRQLTRAIKVKEGSNIDTDELSSSLTTVANNVSDVNTVANHITTITDNVLNVVKVADSITNVNLIGNDISNVNSVAADLSNIDTLKNNLTNVDTLADEMDNIKAVVNNLDNINNASLYAQNAKDWSVKTDDTVDGSEFSAKYYAQQAAAGQLQSNWSETNVNSNSYIWHKPTSLSDFKDDLTHSLLHKTQITNTLLEISQDVRLSLLGTTLTIKTGTKLWYPAGTSAATLSIGDTYGAGKITAISYSSSKLFYQVEVQSDIGLSYGATDAVCFVWSQNTGINANPTSEFSSGAAANVPSGGIYYATNTNEFYINGTKEIISFPIAIVTSGTASGSITSIDQVFNGFGYVGTAIYVLPGVKYLEANGINADGTLNNDEVTISDVKVLNLGIANFDGYFTLNYTGSTLNYKYDAIISEQQPVVDNIPSLWYNPKTNVISRINADAAVITPYREWCYGRVTTDANKRVTSITPNYTFRIPDYNELLKMIESIGADDIGTIKISAVPLDNAKYHLLDGSLLSGSGIYSKFVEKIGKLYTENPDANYFTTEVNWQNEVSTYGSCGKFVYDSSANTVRIPKYDNQIWTQNIEADTASVVGNGTAITYVDGNNLSTTMMKDCGDNLYALAKSSTLGIVGTSGTRITTSNGGIMGLTSDPNNSGIIANLPAVNSNTEVYYYIVVGTGYLDPVTVQIENVVTDINEKLDKDGSNVPATLSSDFISKFTPNWNSPISLGLPSQPTNATTQAFTCPSAGIVYIAANRGNTAGNTIRININGSPKMHMSANNAYCDATFNFIVNKSDVVLVNTDTSGTTWTVRNQYFYPMKGV